MAAHRVHVHLYMYACAMCACRYACVLTGAGCTFWRLGDRSSKVYNRWRDERDGPAPVGAFRDLRSAADVLTASGIAHWSSPTDGGKVYRWPVPPAAAAAASTECEDEDEDEEEDEEADDDGKKKLSGQEQAVVARFVSDLLYSILHACGDAQAWVKVPWGVAAADTYTSYHGGELLGYVQTLHARCHTFVDYEEEEGYRPEWAEAGDEEYWPNECRGLKAGV